MKRSEINKALRELEAMCEKYHCYLPPFCHFTPAQWQTVGHEYDEVRDYMLGLDITDNRFNPPVGRFSAIEEDEAPHRLLCSEYPASE